MSEEQETEHQITTKERAFINSYFENYHNGTKAYLALHPTSTYNNAKSCAHDILTKPYIQAEIRRIVDENAMTVDEALLRKADVARGDIGDLLDDNGLLDIRRAKLLKKTGLLRKIKQKTITSIGKSADDPDTEITEIEFEMYDAEAARRDILKMHGKFIDKVALQNPDGSNLELKINDKQYDRAISTLADALRKVIPGTGDESDGPVGSAK